MMTIVRFGEQMIVKAMSIPVFCRRRADAKLALQNSDPAVERGAALETPSLIPPHHR